MTTAPGVNRLNVSKSKEATVSEHTRSQRKVWSVFDGTYMVAEGRHGELERRKKNQFHFVGRRMLHTVSRPVLLWYQQGPNGNSASS